MAAFWTFVARQPELHNASLPTGQPINRMTTRNRRNIWLASAGRLPPLSNNTIVGRIVYSLLFCSLFLAATATSAAVTSFVEFHKQGVNGVTGLRAPVAVTVSPDGATVYASGYDYTFTPSYTAFGTITVFSRNPATNQLTLTEVIAQGTDSVDGLGTSARSAAVSPDGKNVYGISNNAIAVFQRDPATGELTWIEKHTDGVNGVDGLAGSWGITVSLDEKSVYSTSSGDSSVAVFARDSSTGTLTFLEFHQDGVNGVDGLGLAYGGLTVSADNKNLYATGYNDHGLAVFTRDPATGLLTFLEVHHDGVNGVDGLGNPGAVSVSPDGASAYISSELDSAVAFFNRDTDTGALTFVESYVNGLNGVSGVSGAWWNAVSPDGSNFYSNGYYSDSLAVFRRNTVTGKLTYIEKHTDNVAGADGLSAPWGLAVSPDGLGVYVTASGESALSVFSMPDTDLSVVKTDSADPVDPVSTLAYQVMVSNNGTIDASGVAIVDTLPSTVSYVSATPDQGTCSETGGTVTCELGALPAGVTTSVTIDVSSGTAGMINNVVSVFGNEHDDDTSNNNDQEDTVVNTAPTANGSSLNTLEDVAASGTLSANDDDGDSLIYTLVANGSNGTAVITDSATGAFTYTPNPNFNGTDDFSFRVNDGIEDSVDALLSITVQPAQDPPVASNGTLSTLEDTAVTGSLSATDIDGDALTYQLVANGARGTAIITNAQTGSVTYTPDPDATGSDSFSFLVNDGFQNSGVATVTITITPMNDTPSLQSPGAQDLSLRVGESRTVALQIQDADLTDNHTLIAHFASSGTAVSNLGTAEINGTNLTVYAAHAGTDEIVLTVSDDGGLSDSIVLPVAIQLDPANIVASALDRSSHKGFGCSLLPQDSTKPDLMLFVYCLVAALGLRRRQRGLFKPNK